MEVELNKYGFYSLINKPSPEELKDYYEKKYYQNAAGNYEQQYSESELNSSTCKGFFETGFNSGLSSAIKNTNGPFSTPKRLLLILASFKATVGVSET